jgi:hypothetical protein
LKNVLYQAGGLRILYLIVGGHRDNSFETGVFKMPDQAKDQSVKSNAEPKTNDGENAELSAEELRAISGGKHNLPPGMPPATTGPIIVNHG